MPETGKQHTVIALKGSQEFDRWLNELADELCLPLTILVDHALRDFGGKHNRPMPRRLTKRPRQKRRKSGDEVIAPR